MEKARRDRFVSLWHKHFGDAELPMVVFFSDERPPKSTSGRNLGPCVIGMLSAVMAGKTLCLSAEDRMCRGARRYLGFAADVPREDFEYFLSYGIPGKVVGERYKKSPELVREGAQFSMPFRAPKEFIVFKRWDKLSEADEPEVVVFIAGMDTMAGLFTLANFDEVEPNSVICPFGSGCASIVHYPYVERRFARQRCVLGMFDISARPYIEKDRASFAVPYQKFERMVDNMDESFLTTESWKTLHRRHRKR